VRADVVEETGKAHWRTQRTRGRRRLGGRSPVPAPSRGCSG
jgi:hypothetical protein